MRADAASARSRIVRRIVIGAGLLAVVVLVALAANPLRWPEPAMRRWLFRKAPLGTSLAEFERVVAREHWHEDGRWRGSAPHAEWGGITGDVVVEVTIGGFRGPPFRVDVDSFWAFDRDGRLVGMTTRRTIDAL